MTRKRQNEQEKDSDGGRRGVEERRGSGADEGANVIVVHFTNPDKGWPGETDQFAISWAAALATKAGHESKHIK